MVAIIERCFEIIRDDAKSLARIVVHRPEEAPEGDWACRYELEGFLRPRSKRVFGIDSYQALYLALKTIATEVAISEEFRSGALKFLNEDVVDIKETMGFAPA